jgi:hypothetical protein
MQISLIILPEVLTQISIFSLDVYIGRPQLSLWLSDTPEMLQIQDKHKHTYYNVYGYKILQITA